MQILHYTEPDWSEKLLKNFIGFKSEVIETSNS